MGRVLPSGSGRRPRAGRRGGGGALPGERRPGISRPFFCCYCVDSPAWDADITNGRYTALRRVTRCPARPRTTRQKRDSPRRGAVFGDAAGGWRSLRSRAISPLRGTREGRHLDGWGLCRRGPPGRCAGVNVPTGRTGQRSRARAIDRPAAVETAYRSPPAWGRLRNPPEAGRWLAGSNESRSGFRREPSSRRVRRSHRASPCGVRRSAPASRCRVRRSAPACPGVDR